MDFCNQLELTAILRKTTTKYNMRVVENLVLYMLSTDRL